MQKCITSHLLAPFHDKACLVCCLR